MRFKLIYCITICCLFARAQQVDSVYLWNRKVLKGIITEVTDSTLSLRYDSLLAPDILDRSKIKGFRLANGYSEIKSIKPRKNALKIHPFSPIYNHIALSYERMGRMYSFETTLGYINSDMNLNRNQGDNYSYVYDPYDQVQRPKFHDGAFIFVGSRLYPFSQLYKSYKRGCGFYIGFNANYVYQKFRGVEEVSYYYYNQSPFYYNKMDVILKAYGVTVHNGWKLVLADRILLDFSLGIGIGSRDATYKNQSNNSPHYNPYLSGSMHKSYHVYSMNSSGIIHNAAISIGYAF